MIPFFTAYYCFPDQILNVYAFSMLRSWLLNTGSVQAQSNEGPVYEGHSPGNVSFSIGSHNSSPETTNQSPSRDELTLKTPQDNLDNISISSQSSRGFNIARSASPSDQFISPSPVLGKSPGSGDSRPQTPLSFPLTAEDTEERPPSRGRERKMSRKISFTQLFVQQGPKTGQQELREKACEYCLRVLDQGERSKNFILLENNIIYID